MKQYVTKIFGSDIASEEGLQNSSVKMSTAANSTLGIGCEQVSVSNIL